MYDCCNSFRISQLSLSTCNVIFSFHSSSATILHRYKLESVCMVALKRSIGLFFSSTWFSLLPSSSVFFFRSLTFLNLVPFPDSDTRSDTHRKEMSVTSFESVNYLSAMLSSVIKLFHLHRFPHLPQNLKVCEWWGYIFISTSSFFP